ncbi:MAG TPA: nitroreductase [Amaricoccus sp.]|uniref:nitroreductase family protein n=1 Tax=Amaricoccus sp. TaxID=1872485 RepID=UPI002CC0ED75|nr:nitroreductase [Amaricoccus sp.]HMQ94218.1 nitroreductase [Amaricoccus sp.]HMR52324.1 nitroreductase [Amaricoccus sp.]HMT99245.1 nitroreductase [Amaricoccus sp.]
MRRPEVTEFLLTRRSCPAKLLHGPAPERAALMRMLTAAMRVPDHGKLAPWRFLVLEGAALAGFAARIRARAAETGQDADKGALAFEQAPMAVAVVASPQPSEKIPVIEQTLSAGAAALSLVNAALAEGWGASWLTGWPAYDRGLVEAALGLGPEEWIAGFVYIGHCDASPPERPRPEPESRVRWLGA